MQELPHLQLPKLLLMAPHHKVKMLPPMNRRDESLLFNLLIFFALFVKLNLPTISSSSLLRNLCELLTILPLAIAMPKFNLFFTALGNFTLHLSRPLILQTLLHLMTHLSLSLFLLHQAPVGINQQHTVRDFCRLHQSTTSCGGSSDSCRYFEPTEQL